MVATGLRSHGRVAAVAEATFAVSLTVPTDKIALSNMPEVKRRQLGEGRQRIDFDETPLMSTYLT